MKSILFVCMGNICRSPVVEAVARTEFARVGLDVRVASAGTQDYHVGQQADRRAIASAAAHGYDVSSHRAAQVDAATLHEFDAVLVMDRVNLRDIAPFCRGIQCVNPALFLPFAGLSAPEEVPDPYYGGDRDFERVIELAREGVQALIARGGMPHNGRGETPHNERGAAPHNATKPKGRTA